MNKNINDSIQFLLAEYKRLIIKKKNNNITPEEEETLKKIASFVNKEHE